MHPRHYHHYHHYHRVFSPTQYIRIYIIVSLVSYTVTRAIIMPGKKGGSSGGGENTKKAAGNARKAEAAAQKQAAADAKQAAAEKELWNQGARSTKKTEDAAAKKAEAAAKKAERDRLLAEEEAGQPSKPKNANKKVAEKRVRGPALDLSRLDSDDDNSSSKPTTINASGIDNALDALSLTASSGNDLKLERHPERRVKAAYEAFEARRLPELIAENKGSSLRRNQLVDMVRKEFDKSSENPFNQVGNVAHNATRDELRAKRADVRAGVENRLGEK